MFEQTFVSPGKSRRQTTLFLALGMQSLVVAVLLLAPLWTVQRIEAGKRDLIIPPLLLVEQPVKVQPAAPASPRASPRVFSLPTRAPVFSIPHAGPLAPGDAPPMPVSSMGSGVITSLPGSFGAMPGPPAMQSVAPPKPRERAPQGPIRVSTGVSQSQLEFGPKPTYPHLAVLARTEGTVRLQAIISRTGRIENVHVLSGNPLLIQAAIEAVRLWRYRPMLLNGEPVEVITEIDVNFSLKP